MKRILVCFLAALSFAAAAPVTPKLVLGIVIDQFRYDYLTRFRSEYKAGFERLLTKGAVFTNARYEHFPTVTAVGHSTFLSGATPSISGIIGNDWWDRAENKKVTSVTDSGTKLLGGDPATAGSSPRRLLVDTLGDEVKLVNPKAKVIGISLKDRSAILPAGHMANGAYWFDTKSGNFVSSTYYFEELPAWVKDFNAARPADKLAGAKWLNRTMTTDFKKLYSDIDASPFGNELIESFAEHALSAEQIGQRGVMDVLSVSFSSNDYVGHDHGPDSPEVHEMCVRTDRLLEKLFQAVDKAVGLSNVVIVLTADHGVAQAPEVNAARKMPGGRYETGVIGKAVEAALTLKYGPGKWVLSDSDQAVYLNLDLEKQHKLDRAAVNRVAAEAAMAVPHVFRVYTREQLIGGEGVDDPVSKRVMNGFNMRRGADVEVLLDPYWIFEKKATMATSGGGIEKSATTHSSTFWYDSHVPVIFMGPGIRAGRYTNQIMVNDIAPTLATLIDVETPSGSVGRALSEILLP